MELSGGEAAKFVQQIAEALVQERFVLLDIGCSGGIHPIWREFGTRLTAFGFDPNIDECQRLQEDETSPHIEYVAGFVGVAEPIASHFAGRPRTERNPWNRLSVFRTSQIRQKEIANASNREKTALNLWKLTRLADETKPILIGDFVRRRQISDIDFMKIDVDGDDFMILSSLRAELDSWRLLGVGIEVNYYGAENSTDHTFHNVDRFMREAGFDLFDLTVRRYAASALPARYELSIPAQTLLGRPLQGDALYLRDLCAPHNLAFARAMGPEKLAKLAALFAIGGLPDHAAEIFLVHRELLAGMLDVDRGLETLAGQAQAQAPISAAPLPYHDYLAAFEHDDPRFYPPAPSGQNGQHPRPPVRAGNNDALAETLKKNIELQQEVEALRRSTSWKITRPLRSASAWLRATAAILRGRP